MGTAVHADVFQNLTGLVVLLVWIVMNYARARRKQGPPPPPPDSVSRAEEISTPVPPPIAPRSPEEELREFLRQLQKQAGSPPASETFSPPMPRTRSAPFPPRTRPYTKPSRTAAGAHSEAAQAKAAPRPAPPPASPIAPEVADAKEEMRRVAPRATIPSFSLPSVPMPKTSQGFSFGHALRTCRENSGLPMHGRLFSLHLKDRATLRQAIVLQAILSPPLGLPPSQVSRH